MKDRVVATVATVMALATFALLLALRGVQQVGDSMSYAVSIKTGFRLFHPHHLLFAPIVRIFWLPLSGVAEAITAAQLHNAAWAAVAVACVFVITRRATGSFSQGTAAGALLLATYGFLFYGTQVEVYVPAAGCSVLLAWQLLSERPLYLVSTTLALAVFYHQPNVLLCVPVLVYLTWRGGRSGLLDGIRVVAWAGGIVLSTYLLVYVTADGPASVRGFVDYTMRYAVGEYSQAWGTVENLGVQGISAGVASQLSTVVALDGAETGVTLWVVSLLSAILVGWNAFRASRASETSGVRLLLLSWLLVDWLFFLWWQPGQREFFVAPLAPLSMLFVLAISDLAGSLLYRRVSGAAVGVLALVLLLANVREIRRPAVPRGSTAAAYLSIVPRECFHLTYRNVMQVLRYDHDLPPERSYNVKLARRRIVNDVETGLVPGLPVDGCVVVPGHEVVPGPKSRQQAEGWLRFYTWLFRLETTATGVRGPSVAILAQDPGPFYLVQGPADVEYDDLSAFFRALDLAVAGRTAGPVFEPWLEAR